MKRHESDLLVAVLHAFDYYQLSAAISQQRARQALQSDYSPSPYRDTPLQQHDPHSAAAAGAKRQQQHNKQQTVLARSSSHHERSRCIPLRRASSGITCSFCGAIGLIHSIHSLQIGKRASPRSPLCCTPLCHTQASSALVAASALRNRPWAIPKGGTSSHALNLSQTPRDHRFHRVGTGKFSNSIVAIVQGASSATANHHNNTLVQQIAVALVTFTWHAVPIFVDFD